MKKFLSIIPFLLLVQTAYCDVAPMNSHFVQKCVKITNIKDFPDFSIVAFTQHPMEGNVESYIINQYDCIEKGYKFNSLYILAAKKSYLQGKTLKTIAWLSDKNLLKANIDIECYGGYVSDDITISAVEEYYKIIAITNTELLLYKYKELVYYNDGSPLSIKTYPEVETKINSAQIDGVYPSTEVLNFLIALMLTIFIESLILFLLFKTKYKNLNIKNQLLFFTGFTASLLTLPYVWFVFPAFIHSQIPYILFSECFAVVIESILIYKLLKIDFKKAILISVICNIISFSIGLLINWINSDINY